MKKTILVILGMILVLSSFVSADLYPSGGSTTPSDFLSADFIWLDDGSNSCGVDVNNGDSLSDCNLWTNPANNPIYDLIDGSLCASIGTSSENIEYEWNETADIHCFGWTNPSNFLSLRWCGGAGCYLQYRTDADCTNTNFCTYDGDGWQDSGVTFSATGNHTVCLHQNGTNTLWFREEDGTIATYSGSGVNNLANVSGNNFDFSTGGGYQEFDLLFVYEANTHNPNWDWDLLTLTGGSTPPATSITTTLISPLDDAINNTLTQSFQYNVTIDNGSLLADKCEFYTNETSNWIIEETINNVPVNVTQNLTHTFSSEGNYIWNINCSIGNTSDFANSNFTLTLDTTNPIIKANVNDIVWNGSLYGQINFTDEREIYSINVSWKNGSILWNGSNLGTTKYLLNISHTVSTLVNNNISARVCDAHTANIISDVDSIRYEKEGVKYVIENRWLWLQDDYISIYPKDSSGYAAAESIKISDRYSPIFNKKTKPLAIETFVIESNKFIDIAKLQLYAGHVVIPSLGENGYWADLEMGGSKYVVRRVSNTKIEVDVYGLKDEKIVSNSVGELNCVTESFKFGNLNPSSSYTTPIFISQNTRFYMNVTQPDSITDINASLYYKTSIYNDTSTNFSIALTTPSTQQNVSFSWILNLDGTLYNVSYGIQEVTTFFIDDCQNYTKAIINYTLYDEENQTVIPGANNPLIKVDLNFNSISGVLIGEFNKSFNANNASICVADRVANESFYIDGLVEYSADNYVHEFNYLQNYTFNDSQTTQDIALYDLLAADSQSFLITYKNSVFLPIDKAVIEILRYYTEEGKYKVVEDGLTNELGQTVGHLVTEDVQYGFVIKKNGAVLSTFLDMLAACPSSPCQINLYDFQSITTVEDFGKHDNLEYTYELNETLGTLTVFFTTDDSSSANMLLSANLYDNWGNNTICSDTVSDSSGNLVCAIPELYGNSSIRAKLYMDGELVTTLGYSLNQKGFEVFGNIGFFMAALMYITLPLMSLSAPIGAIILAIIGMIASGLLGLTVQGSLFSITSIVIWFICAGVILVWKIESRKN